MNKERMNFIAATITDLRTKSVLAEARDDIEEVLLPAILGEMRDVNYEDNADALRVFIKRRTAHPVYFAFRNSAEFEKAAEAFVAHEAMRAIDFQVFELAMMLVHHSMVMHRATGYAYVPDARNGNIRLVART